MKQTLLKLRESLRPIYGKGETEAIIRIIFHHLKGWNLTDMLIHSEDELSPFMKGEVDKILKRLLNHEPVQYITGEARFHGMDLKIKPGVLIPRPETDELVDIIIDENKDQPDLQVLDLCTGSGCIAIALARNLPFSKVTALDVSTDALLIASENIKDTKTKVNLIKADVFEWVPQEKFDIIVSNPPYVLEKEKSGIERNVKDYEPPAALFVKDDNPLEFYIRIADIGRNFLKDNGLVYFEINPLASSMMKDMMQEKGYSDVEVLKDSFGKDRFLKARFVKKEFR